MLITYDMSRAHRYYDDPDRHDVLKGDLRIRHRTLRNIRGAVSAECLHDDRLIVRSGWATVRR